MSSVEYTLQVNELYDDTDPISIERYAKKLIGNTFKDIKKKQLPQKISDSKVDYENESNKGGLGTFLEEQYFGYKANTSPLPDFPKAGVELKVSPYEENTNGRIRAGERLVLTMIPYDQAVEGDIYKSHLWAKCHLLLLIYYLRDKQKDNMDYRIDYATLFTPPKQDLDIIIQDYKTIIDKISSGKAHELSESDTMYLGACTKGSTAEKSLVPQFYAPDIKAKRRAFCFKQPYMTYVLNNYIIPGKGTYEPIIKTDDELKEKSFEDAIKSKIRKFIGKSDKELCELFGREYNNNKAQWINLVYLMLGIKSNKAEEFEKANIVVKSICLEEDGSLVESSPLPNIRFKELADDKKEWEDSDLYCYLDETKFFIVVWQKKGNHRILKGCQLWNMPHSDLEGIVYKEWKAIKDVVKNGVVLTGKGNRVVNNFPTKDNNGAIHIRPHAQKSFYVFEDGSTFGSGSISDTDELPDGRRMTKQSFWLNNTYLLSQLNEELKK